MTDERAAPRGEVTFLFTDVEGSTKLWERAAELMEPALAEHDRRLRATIEEWNGYVFTTAGDSFAVAFASPSDALAAAVAAQRLLQEPCAGLELRVRMGLHTGTATSRDADYFGAVVNRCARLMSAAHGGQILVSGATAQLLSAAETRVAEPADSGGSASDARRELVDLGEHRLKDLLRPERIFQVRHPALDDGFPALRTLSGPGIDLPVQLTSFVGRERELDEVRELLANPAHRLVTLTGSGGAGKTRLAYQVAAEALEDFPDGIRAVELTTLLDADLVHDEIAAAVGAQGVPGTPLVETITDRIGNQQLLLVIDNSEHLIDVVAELARVLLLSCPNLNIVATSRERLGCRGEVSYRVPSLGLPSPRAAHQDVEVYLKGLRDCDAMRLFTERAELARPDFAIDETNVDAAVSICRRLDGIPLALELAAARLRALSPAQIADRLDERFRLLGDASRGALERHRTLAATIDWSHDHLSDGERAVFRRASVFSGSFSLDAAEVVCATDLTQPGDGGSASVVDPFDVLDLVSGLLDKSMLVPDEVDGEVRYRLLESMRHYGLDRLVEAGERDAVARAHAVHFVQYGEQLQRLQRAGEIGRALAGLEREIDNVRGALRFGLDEGHLELAARMVGAVGYLWYARGLFREGIEWCRELFEAAPELSDERLAATLHAYGTLLGSWARPAEGVEMMRREVELRRQIGDPARLAAALNNLGSMQCELGDLDHGVQTLREAAEQFRLAGEPATLALASIGYSYKDIARYAEASDLFAQALAEAVAADDDYGTALSRTGLGECAVHQGRLAEARIELDAARAGFGALGVRPGVAYADLLLALLGLAEGAPDEAARKLADALVDPDAHWYEAVKFWILQVAARLLPDQRVAAQLLGAAAQHYESSTQPPPAWVVEDLEAGRARLSDALGEDEFETATTVGRRLAPRAALTLADEALHWRLAEDHDPSPTG